MCIYINICSIGSVRWDDGDNTVKIELFSLLVLAVAIFRGYVEFVIRPHIETNNGSERKVCPVWPQFRSWFRPCGT